MNAKFVISYDGTKFQGSQKQPNGLSVEDTLLKAFRQINIDTKIVLSGRTDKDVHATGQVFNCQLPYYWSDLKKLKKIFNKHLPPSISVKSIQKVQDDFHARFHAKKRVYRYLITSNKTTVFNSSYISYHKYIDEERIKCAIKLFEGVHDFEFFHKKGSDKKNTIREIFSTNFYKYKDIYVFKFCANSYLRSQIRLMVGILLHISDGKLTIKDLENQLNKKEYKFKMPASPYGLYLTKVYY